ncbi:unnamed protein product [Didymodactylos carnosus]|uniref:Uncharacterized protein n=1 Tax=Didymodactylos carnosus TaxID=1234261 RepID=A0A815EIW8_9BILA|nr:unnamed protein product [Didymodactylos carnosus]CAF1312101.1 unnamed protein product [Didymodactylos carnosus]CAF3953187.1 unnamed protein product [Didymodactylos carnosus]CAF4150525.1 unnamed protein product [Didymodactylos carnosus]
MSSLEDLSNELIYDLFDYLYYDDIYKGFRGLNQRFENLTASTSRMHADITPLKFDSYYKYIFPEMKHRLASLKFSNWDFSDSNQFWKQHPLAEFSNLYSLILNGCLPSFRHALPTVKYLKIYDCRNFYTDFYSIKHVLKFCPNLKEFSFVLTGDNVIATSCEHLLAAFTKDNSIKFFLLFEAR